MTPSKLTDVVERATLTLFEQAQLGMSKGAANDFLNQFSRDLILAVREDIGPESHGAEVVQAWRDFNRGYNICRAEILRSLDAFLGDNE